VLEKQSFLSEQGGHVDEWKEKIDKLQDIVDQSTNALERQGENRRRVFGLRFKLKDVEQSLVEAKFASSEDLAAIGQQLQKTWQEIHKGYDAVVSNLD